MQMRDRVGDRDGADDRAVPEDRERQGADIRNDQRLVHDVAVDRKTRAGLRDEIRRQPPVFEVALRLARDHGGPRIGRMRRQQGEAGRPDPEGPTRPDLQGTDEDRRAPLDHVDAQGLSAGRHGQVDEAAERPLRGVEEWAQRLPKVQELELGAGPIDEFVGHQAEEVPFRIGIEVQEVLVDEGTEQSMRGRDVETGAGRSGTQADAFLASLCDNHK
ncbi:hypothetical protein ABIE45_000427 [Methylobacterium sp. OAE515]